MPDKLLLGQAAIVTGAASGIGHAIAAALAREGAWIALVDQDAHRVTGAAQDLRAAGCPCAGYAFDLKAHAAIPPLVNRIHRERGRLDILVNCAALIDSGCALLDIDETRWDEVQAVNLKAPLLLMQAFARLMVLDKRPGRIVNITSSSAFRAVMSYPAYGSSKAALTQLTRSAAAELGPHSINVNCVAPGVTITPLLECLQGLEGAQRLSESGPLANLLRRPSLPEDVAETVRFLCLPASRQITGQTIHTSAGAIV